MDLRFPQSGAADPNLVSVIGRPEHVDEAIDHLLNLEEEYVSSSSRLLRLLNMAATVLTWSTAELIVD